LAGAERPPKCDLTVWTFVDGGPHEAAVVSRRPAAKRAKECSDGGRRPFLDSFRTMSHQYKRAACAISRVSPTIKQSLQVLAVVVVLYFFA
jgi:hypothetical protein